MKDKGEDSFQTDSEDENTPILELIPIDVLIIQNKSKSKRFAITAESYGHYNKQPIFHSNIIEKTKTQLT